MMECYFERSTERQDSVVGARDRPTSWRFLELYSFSVMN